MTNESNPDHNRQQDRQFDAMLGQMSESELTHLHHNIEALRADIDTIFLPDGKPVEILTDAQNLLKIWDNKVNHFFALTQAKDAYGQLHNWDNEGGTVPHGASRRLLSRKINGERTLVWADAEEAF